jgi:hypothetical protein
MQALSAFMPQPKKPNAKKILGIYFGLSEVAEYREIRKEATSFRLRPSDYARRLLRIARKSVREDPGLLLAK